MLYFKTEMRTQLVLRECFNTDAEEQQFGVQHMPTLGARGLSCAVSGLGQRLYCDPLHKHSLRNMLPQIRVI